MVILNRLCNKIVNLISAFFTGVVGILT